jgi:hypothetical protein
VTDGSEHSNETSGSIKCRDFLTCISQEVKLLFRLLNIPIAIFVSFTLSIA